MEFELHAATMDGMYHAQMPIAILLQSKEDSGEAPKPFLMQLETARSAHYEEGPSCAVLYMPIIKRLTGCGNIPARKLFEDARTIKTRCYHFVLSNHDFIVLSHEEAVWRRLRYYRQSVIFRDDLEIDANNPFHRPMDRSFNDDFINDVATRAAYLSILVFYHMKLMRYHGGVIEHVPHPTIDRHTLDFRNRQDTLNRFITERVYQLPSYKITTSLVRVGDAYCDWYDKNIRGGVRHYRQEILQQLRDSAMKNIIEETGYGTYIKAGYFVMDDDKVPVKSDDVGDAFDSDSDDDEKALDKLAKNDPQLVKTAKNRFAEARPYIEGGAKQLRAKDYSMKFPVETADEYLGRVEREWDEMMAEDAHDDSKKIDLSKTYDYEEEDPDCEDGDIPTTIHAPLDVRGPADRHTIEMMDGDDSDADADADSIEDLVGQPEADAEDMELLEFVA